MIFRQILIWVLIIWISECNGQSDLSIGQWKAHLPYQRGVSVTQSEEKIIYATPLSILTIDKEDGAVSFISKVDGLSDIGIQRVRYDEFNDQLFVIYTNSNIDIIKGSEIINIPNVNSNTTIIGDKRIFDIHLVDQQQAFFATGFGIVEFNPQDYNFGATILTGIGVNQISSLGSTLLAATDEGVYAVDQNEVSVIADFNRWELLGPDQGLPEIFEAQSIARHQNNLYLGIENSLYKSTDSGSSWDLLHIEESLTLSFLSPSEDRLITGWTGPDFNAAVLFFDENGQFLAAPSDCIGVPVDAIRSSDGRIWYGDRFDNFRFASDYTSTCVQTDYNAPYSDAVSDIAVNGDQVIVASGGVAENFTYLFSREGFYFLNEGRWQNFNEFERASFAEFDLLSVFRVALHPSLPKIYAGSYWAGLLEYDLSNDEFILYNQENSTLRGTIGDPARERISGLAFDSEENLWVATYNAPEPINVLDVEGQWFSFDVPSNGTLTDILIDREGYKWFPVQGGGGGILVYDSGPSIQSVADDRYRFISRSNSELTTNVVLSLVEDLNGQVWVGTNEGPVIFDCGPDVFEAECVGVRRKVVQDSIVAFLLADQQINAMEIDGANRKWLGTRNGLFVQSPQGEFEVAHFTEKNSPLFDDEIQALAYDGEQGLMWVGTNKGLISFRTESTAGSVFHRESDVYAFPNPVPPEYRGPIAIKGLVTDALVKITDINGLLVSEIEALGGQAIWDGLDLKGEMVSSGVYLVFSTDVNAFDNPDSFVTKIMVLR